MDYIQEKIEQIRSVEEPLFDWDDVVIEQFAANEALDDPIISFGSSKQAVQEIVDYCGFPRLPATRGELENMIDFRARMARLDPSGAPKNIRKGIEAFNAKLWSIPYPDDVKAFELFCAGDMEGFAKYLRDTDMLTRLGTLIYE